MNFLSIDPGVHECAVGRWERGVLMGLGYVPPGVGGPRGVAEFVAVERPQIDGRCPRPQDLVDLAWSGALLAGSYGVPVREYTPRVWKGAVPKPQHLARVLGLDPAPRGVARPAPLSLAEIALLPKDWEMHVRRACERHALDRGKHPGVYYFGTWTGHNLLDAVALGIYVRDHVGV